jgi:ABC-2 type transport system permease protein
MTTAVLVPVRPADIDDRRTGTGLAHVVRSEWTKLMSLRSTWWTLLSLVVVTIGTSTLLAWGASSNLNKMSAQDLASLDVTSNSMAGLAFGQLAIAVLGVLIVCSEYSTGGIRSTFTAVPQRLRVLAAKGIVFSVVATVVGAVTAFGAFFASMLFWSRHHMATSLSDPTVLRAVLGGGLYVLASGLLGFALGAIIRHTAGAITAAVGLLFVAPPLTQLLPGDWGRWVSKHFTSNAGQHIADVLHLPGVMAPWTGYLTMTLWWVVPMILGAWLIRRRDA